MTVDVFDDRRCILGEGPLWHPERRQLFWFDILSRKLLSRDGEQQLEWQFDEHVSAAGWVTHSTVLMASETQLFLFDVDTGAQKHICALEADNPITRSNDGRADPWGGFWIGTMGKQAEPSAGAIYRYIDGKLEKLFSDVTISNSICFSPDRKFAYFTDTPRRQIMRQALDGEGWPTGAAKLFIDLRAEGLNPDGAVVDQQGCLWNAQWGAGRVARYGTDGQFLNAYDFPAQHMSCPAFGGEGLQTLFATTAFADIPTPSAQQGRTYCLFAGVKGQAEYRLNINEVFTSC